MSLGDEGPGGPDSVGLGFKSKVIPFAGENNHLVVSLLQKI